MTDKSPVDRAEVIELDLPQRSIKDGLMGLFFRQYSILASTLAEITSANDPRITFLTDLIIATVPDDDLREELRAEKHKLIKEKIKQFAPNNNGTEPSNHDKAELVRQACMETVGKVTSFLDQSIGLSHKLEVQLE